jgi:hypothetical protein
MAAGFHVGDTRIRHGQFVGSWGVLKRAKGSLEHHDECRVLYR